MAARIIDGNKVAERIRTEVAAAAAELTGQGHKPRLAAILIGEPHASVVYARSQARHCEALGIDYELVQLPEECTSDQLAERIEALNADPAVTGIILLLPLPNGIDPHLMQYRIDPYKDVEGVNPANIGLVFYGQPIIAPCTALSIMEIVAESGAALRGCQAVVVGQGAIVGRPTSVLLVQEDATVCCCNEFTPHLPEHTRHADLLVVAAGKAGLITAEHVKPGAIVIDVGINRVRVPAESGGEPTTKIVGDVDFESVREVAAAITPVPGGVGPVTVAMLLRNTIEAARKQQHRAL